MIDPVVLAALVYLVKVLFEKYLPQFPVSEELIYAVIVFLLGLFGLLVVRVVAAKYLPSLVERGFIGK